jgi:WD40 repeat protein
LLIQERYRLVKLIGNWGKYQTFIAVDEGVFPPISCIVQKFLNVEKIQSLLIEKAVKLKILNHHPQIPNLLDFFGEKEDFYLVYEFIQGENLKAVLTKQGVFQEVQIWQILKNVLPILDFIHSQNIIHGNIKPESLVYQSLVFKNSLNSEISANLDNFSLFLVNFASAQIFNSDNYNKDTEIIGSPEYIAPEQLQGKATFSSDLYSLGVTCIYLLTQISPFDLFDIANNCWVWQDYLTITISEQLTQTLNKLINHNLEKRYKSTSEIITQLGIKKNHPRLSASICVFKNITIKNNLDSQINTLAFSPDNKILASGDNSKNIKIWDVENQRLLFNIIAHKKSVNSLAFSPNGQILASASDDKTIKLWNVSRWEEIVTLNGHFLTVKSVAFNNTGNILASGSWDKTVKIWDVNTGAEICTITGHKLQINAVAFSPKNDIVASASCDRTVKLWQLQLDKTSIKCTYHLLATLADHTMKVLAVAFSPNGEILATGSDDNTIKLWDVNTGELITTLLGHSWSVTGLVFTSDGKILISCSWDKKVKLWNVQTKSEITTLSDHTDSISTVVISADGKIIATGSKDKTIKLWNFKIPDFF